VEDHSGALLHWARLGVRDAVVLHLDAHADLQAIPGAKLQRIRQLYQQRDWHGLQAVEGAEEDDLYHLGNFFRAAAHVGMVREIYWVIPFGYHHSSEREGWLRALLKGYDLPPGELDAFRFDADDCYSGSAHGVFLHVCDPDQLPVIEEPILLSLDADFFPPYAGYKKSGRTAAVEQTLRALAARHYDYHDVVVSYSVNGGYLNVLDRWLADAAADSLRGKQWSPKLLALLDAATAAYQQDRADTLQQIITTVPAEYTALPALRAYAAFAYYGLGKEDRALTEARQLCSEKPGYCFVLTDLGQCLLDQGRLEAALVFFQYAYGMNPAMNYRQFDLSRALRQAGMEDTAEHYYEIYARLHGLKNATGDEVAGSLPLEYKTSPQKQVVNVK
jgi:tetratricopeptide (TPR) repeat protein